MNQWIVAAGLALLVVAPAVGARLLTLSGGGAAFLVGFSIYGAGGWKASVPLLLFFITSNLLGLVGAERKKRLKDGFGKEQRTWQQVFANGLVGAVACVWAFETGNQLAMGAFLGAFAAANADTWATEIGTWLGRKPFNIVTGRPVDDGESGGVTFAGWAGAVLGGLVIGLSVALWGSPVGAFWFGLVGLCGSLVDSLLGATVQAKYYCAVCGKTTEKPQHCERPALRVSGWRWMTNDTVNFFCTLSGALLGSVAGGPVPFA